MDCQRCQPSLLDLLYGELPPEAAAEARAHMAECAQCEAAYGELEAGLELSRELPSVEPPQAVSARLMQLAEEQASIRRAAARRSRQLGPFRAFVESLRRFAMARQVGMATIMLLIVAVGLWSVPEMRRQPEAGGVTVVNPDPDGEAATSPGVQPAEPLDLQVDLRRGRIRAKGAEAERRAPSALPPSGETEAIATEKAEPEQESLTAGESEPAELDLDDLSDVFEPPGGARDTQGAANGEPGDAPTAAAEVGSGGGELDSRKSSAQGAPAPEAFPASPRPRSAMRSRKKAAAAPAPTAKSAAPPSLAESEARGALAPPDAQGSGASLADSYRQATADAARGEHARAIEGFQKILDAGASPLRAKALLGLARATRDLHGCRAALDGFSRAAQQGGGRLAGEALIELGLCHRQLGQQDLARQALERASRIEAVADRARRLLSAPAAARPTTDDAMMGLESE
ncbi:MAG: hypothetical protein PVI30_17395 [Myxococcales bacterium]|jgi:tetratricopeptide (TPR) repeat protein